MLKEYNSWIILLFVQSCLNLCDPMDWSALDSSVLHYLPKFSQTCPLSKWCYPTISSSVALFSSCPPSFPASGSFPMSLLFAWGCQSIGVLVLAMNIRCWLPLGLTGLISLLSKGLTRVFSSSTIWKFMGVAGISSLATSPFLHHLLIAFSCLCQASFFLPLMTHMIAFRAHLDNPR